MESTMQEIKALGYRTVEVTWRHRPLAVTEKIGLGPDPRTVQCILSPETYPGAEEPNDSIAVRDQLKRMIAIRDLGSLRRKDDVVIVSVEPVCNCGPQGCRYDDGKRFFIEPNQTAVMRGHWDHLIDAGRAMERNEDWSARLIAEGRPDILRLTLTALRREYNHR
jgi:hypothetical protein